MKKRLSYCKEDLQGKRFFGNQISLAEEGAMFLTCCGCVVEYYRYNIKN